MNISQAILINIRSTEHKIIACNIVYGIQDKVEAINKNIQLSNVINHRIQFHIR